MNFFTRIWSYISPVTLKKYQSQHSGNLYVSLENGKKVLNTSQVNYSFNSLHRVFQKAFSKTDLHISDEAKILMLGLGAGSIVHIIRKDYRSNASITAVEIDPVIIEIAKTEFGIEHLQPIRLVLEDATLYMKNNNEKFDLICVDLFVQDKVPAEFLDSTFISRLISSLNPSGRIYFNFMDCSSQLTAKFDRMIKELGSLGGDLAMVKELSFEENNRVVVVTK